MKLSDRATPEIGVQLSPDVREKFISELAAGQPIPARSWLGFFAGFCSWMISTYVWAKAYSGLPPSTPDSPEADHIVLIVFFGLGRWWLERDRDASRKSFATKDDQMLQVLHGELKSSQKTTAIVVAVMLGAALIVGAIWLSH